MEFSHSLHINKFKNFCLFKLFHILQFTICLCHFYSLRYWNNFVCHVFSSKSKFIEVEFQFRYISNSILQLWLFILDRSENFPHVSILPFRLSKSWLLFLVNEGKLKDNFLSSKFFLKLLFYFLTDLALKFHIVFIYTFFIERVIFSLSTCLVLQNYYNFCCCRWCFLWNTENCLHTYVCVSFVLFSLRSLKFCSDIVCFEKMFIFQK